MKPVFVILALLLSWPCLGQFGYTEISYYSRFESSTTVVVKTGEPMFDDYLETVLKNFWTINPFLLIEGKSLPNYVSAKDVFFLLPVMLTYERSSPPGEYKALQFYLVDDLKYTRLGKLDYSNMEKLSVIKFQPTHYPGNLYVQAEITRAIQFINNHCRFVLTEKPENHISVNDRLKTLLAHPAETLASKKLLLAHHTLGRNLQNEDDIKACYDHRFAIVEQEDIYTSIIEQHADDVYIISYTDFNVTYQCIVQSCDSKILYGEVAKGINHDVVKSAYLKTLNASIGTTDVEH